MKTMITNNGVHPSDKWAEVSADEILSLIKIDENSVTAGAAMARQQKRDVTPKVIGALTTIYQNLQEIERSELGQHGHKHMATQIDVTKAMDAGVQSIVAAMDGTMFADFYNRDEIKADIARVVGQHSTNILHIERKHHETSKA